MVGARAFSRRPAKCEARVMKHPEGLIGWVDLSTSDVPAAKTFYTELFDWTYTDLPTPMGVDYTQFYRDGLLVAGAGPLPPDVAAAGMPSMWNSYVLVADVDAVMVKVAAAGGTVLMPGMDVMDQGRMAMLADPSGAPIGLWQPKAHQGAEVFNIPGALTWNELQTRGLAAAEPFYTEVFGWAWEAGPDPGYDIAMLASKSGEDKANAGALTMPPGVPQDAPNFWMVYFAVTDAAVTVASALTLGGKELYPLMTMGSMTFGGIVDPTGAVFSVASVSATED